MKLNIHNIKKIKKLKIKKEKKKPLTLFYETWYERIRLYGWPTKQMSQ